MKLLMITGLGSAKNLISGRKGAFYNTLEEFHKYWDRIDIMAPRIVGDVGSDGDDREEQPYQAKQGAVLYPAKRSNTLNLFGNVYVHISPWPLIFFPVWFFKKGLETYKEQKFDLMTVQDYPPFYNGILARLLWNRIKIPYILEFHHIPGYPKAANLKEKIYANKTIWRLYWKFFGFKAKAVRVVNQKQTPEFLKRAGVSERKIVYIPSMYIDLEVFKPMDLKKEYDLIFVGRLADNKGIRLFLEAVKKLNAKAIVIGLGPFLEIYKIQYSRYNIQFHGWAKDSGEIAELMNKSKILIMSSYNEGGPRVVLEAMACGVSVLATNVGLMPDFAGKNAVKIIDWDAKDIADKAKELLENEEERSRLSQAGLEIAKQFEKHKLIKNYADKLIENINKLNYS